MAYPFSPDTFNTRVFGEVCDASHMNAVQTSITTIQAKLGINSSTDPASLDYIVKSSLVTDPGHKHSSGSITSVAESTVTRPVTPILARVAQNESVSGGWTFGNAAGTTFNAGGVTIGGGYGSLSNPAAALRIGGGGTSPDVASICFGADGGEKLHIGSGMFTWTPLFTFTTNGRLGIGRTDPHAELQLSQNVLNKKIVLWETIGADNEHQFFGFGINPSTLRFQVANFSSGFSFFVGQSSSASFERMRLDSSVVANTPPTRLLVTDIDTLSLQSLPVGSGAGIISAISANSFARAITLEYYTAVTGEFPQFAVRRSRGLPGTHAPLLIDDAIGALRFQGQTTTNPTAPSWVNASTIFSQASANWIAGSFPAKLMFSCNQYGTPATMAALYTISGTMFAGQSNQLLPNMVLYPEGHLVIGPYQATTNNYVVREAFKIASPIYSGRVVVSICGTGDLVNTNQGCGALELTSPSSDGAGKTIGSIEWSNPNNTSTGLSTPEKLVSTILVTTVGGTANKRGASMQFYTRPDNQDSVRAVMSLDATGNLFITNTFTAPAADAVGGGYLYVDAGVLKYRGTSGGIKTVTMS